MTWWAYSAHWEDEGVTITVSVEAPTEAKARQAGQERMDVLFPGRAGTHTTEMAEDMTAKLAAARRQR